MAYVKRYKTDDGTDCGISHYDSVAEMESDCLDRAYLRPSNILHRGALENDASRGRRDWYGLPSLAAVKEALRVGYPDGAAQVDALYDAIAPTLPRAVDFRRQRVRSDQGDSLDIHAVNRGALDKAWETAKRKAHAGSGLIRIAVDICANGNVRADALRWRGIAALALSRAMTKAGYSVEIVAGQSGSEAIAGLPDLRTTITVTVKPRHAAVDTATLAATICLPGFFRYIGFASIIRQADELGKDVSSWLGQAVKLETVLPVPEKIAQVVAPETVNSQASAQQWVKDTVAMLQGATLNKETSR